MFSELEEDEDSVLTHPLSGNNILANSKLNEDNLLYENFSNVETEHNLLQGLNIDPFKCLMEGIRDGLNESRNSRIVANINRYPLFPSPPTPKLTPRKRGRPRKYPLPTDSDEDIYNGSPHNEENSNILYALPSLSDGKNSTPNNPLSHVPLVKEETSCSNQSPIYKETPLLSDATKIERNLEENTLENTLENTQENTQEITKYEESPAPLRYNRKQNYKSVGNQKKWAIASVKTYFPEISTLELANRLKITPKQVTDFWRWYKKKGIKGMENKTENKSRKKVEVEAGIREGIEEFIEESHMRGGMPLAKDIWKYLRRAHDYKHHIAHLISTLHTLGYTYKKVKKRYADKFKPAAVENKILYLRELFENRVLGEGDKLEEIYVDESYIDETHVQGMCWVKEGASRDILVPTSWNRICMVAAISIHGWVGVNYSTLHHDLRASEVNGIISSGSIMYFKAGKVDQPDYHNNFNKHNFTDYFENRLLVNLQQPSVIIMDRCRYHLFNDENEFNPRSARRDELEEWYLAQNFEKFDSKLKLKDLRELACKHVPEPRSKLQNLAEESGNSVLYLPQYHPELNPIEMAWSKVKQGIKDSPIFNMREVLTEQLPASYREVDGLFARKLFQHVEKEISASLELINAHPDNYPSQPDSETDVANMENPKIEQKIEYSTT